MIRTLKKEISSHKIVYGLLVVLLALATFVRVYRTDIILQFFYDQGRDALSIWDLIHKGDVFLIGPTTGIAGIFRGPFYYYLIAPLYWLGGGNPVYPAIFLALTTVVAIGIAFVLSKEFANYKTAFFVTIFASFSYYLVYASRWLSNPTPMLLLSMLFLASFVLIMKGYQWAWILLSTIAGLSLFHFGSSGEFFYFPATAVFTIWQFKHFPSLKVIVLSAVAFVLTASPLLLFDIRNDFLLSNNIKAFLFEKESFQTNFWEVLNARFGFYNGAFWGKIFPSVTATTKYLVLAFWLLFVYKLPLLTKNKYFILVSIILLSPVIGLLFFQGNEGNIYGYYMTGYYFIWIIFLGLVLNSFWDNVIGKIFVLVFLVFFLQNNYPIVKSYITDKVDGETTIAFAPQKEAIEWAYENADGEEFNTDVYVPPVIPYAYDYLFTWYESMPIYSGRVEDQKELLYTLYEQDPPHPERLDAWLERQAGIGEVIDEAKFAGITIQRRRRIQ